MLRKAASFHLDNIQEYILSCFSQLLSSKVFLSFTRRCLHSYLHLFQCKLPLFCFVFLNYHKMSLSLLHRMGFLFWQTSFHSLQKQICLRKDTVICFSICRYFRLSPLHVKLEIIHISEVWKVHGFIIVTLFWGTVSCLHLKSLPNYYAGQNKSMSILLNI